jgi:hypothetical protein
MVQASLGKKGDPISKITEQKSAAGVTQAVEHLSCKCEGLSSSPKNNPPKKNRQPLRLLTHNKMGFFFFPQTAEVGDLDS